METHSVKSPTFSSFTLENETRVTAWIEHNESFFVEQQSPSESLPKLDDSQILVANSCHDNVPEEQG